MKILVPIARTEDYNARIVVNKAGDDIERGGVAMVINPFDEIAVEEALRLLDGGEGEIIVVAIGGDEAAPELRRALAMGAHRAIQINTEVKLMPEVVTPLLAAVAGARAARPGLDGQAEHRRRLRAGRATAGASPRLAAGDLRL